MKGTYVARAETVPSPCRCLWCKAGSSHFPRLHVSAKMTVSCARIHRTLTLPSQAGACATQPATWCRSRTFFDGWKGAAPEIAQIPRTEQPPPPSSPPAAAPAAKAAADAEVNRLRQQVVDLKEALEASQETVKQLLALSSMQRAPSCCEANTATAKKARGACYVVRTSEELVDALRGRGSEYASRTILLDGHLFFLGIHGKVEIDQARVSIVGNNSMIIGHLSVRGRGAVLAASDVFFLCPCDLELRQGSGAAKTTTNAAGKKPKENVANLSPVVGAIAGAGVHLDRCVLSNGRDGVYLGMGSHCTLRHVRIVNCIRGLYEGVGCQTSVVDTCAFQANRYDMVLLGPGGAERTSRLYKQASSSSSPSLNNAAAFTATFSKEATIEDVLGPGVSTRNDVALQQNRAQVVLQHSPITDIYEECWVDGQRVELTGADATAGLSDPLF